MAFVSLALIFVIFALSRVVARYYDGSMSTKELIFWILFWVSAGIIILWPGLSDKAAQLIGIKRGIDAIVYITVIVIYYLVFRIYIRLNHIEREITELVRSIAVNNPKKSSN